jgi:hypothetical protein
MIAQSDVPPTREKAAKTLTLRVEGPSTEVTESLQETRAYLAGASDVLSKTAKQGCALEIELTLI